MQHQILISIRKNFLQRKPHKVNELLTMKKQRSTYFIAKLIPEGFIKKLKYLATHISKQNLDNFSSKKRFCNIKHDITLLECVLWLCSNVRLFPILYAYLVKHNFKLLKLFLEICVLLSYYVDDDVAAASGVRQIKMQH